MDPRQTAMQNMFFQQYGGGGAPPPQQGQGTDATASPGQAAAGMNLQDQQQQQAAAAMQAGAYPNMFSGFFAAQSQQAAAAAHAAATMAEQRLSGAYGAAGSAANPSGQAQAPPQDYSDPRFAAFPQQAYGDPEEYNRLLLQRLQQGQGWMYPGMPQAAAGGADAYAENGMLGPWSTTSAGLLGKISGPEEKKKSVRKKHKDKPKRPLSAYNLFFKDERKTILDGIPNKDGAKEEEEDEDAKKEGGRKRKKAPHGKIGFENLAKIIGQRWQKLEPERVEHYKKLAAKDMKRYKEEMEVFLTKIENEKKAKLEAEQGITSEPAPADEGDDATGEPAAKKAKTEEEPIKEEE